MRIRCYFVPFLSKVERTIYWKEVLLFLLRISLFLSILLGSHIFILVSPPVNPLLNHGIIIQSCMGISLPLFTCSPLWMLGKQWRIDLQQIISLMWTQAPLIVAKRKKRKMSSRLCWFPIGYFHWILQDSVLSVLDWQLRCRTNNY